MIDAALQSALIDACRAAGEPLVGEILRVNTRLIGDVAAHGALIARHVTDVEDFLPAYGRLMQARLAPLQTP